MPNVFSAEENMLSRSSLESRFVRMKRMARKRSPAIREKRGAPVPKKRVKDNGRLVKIR